MPWPKTTITTDSGEKQTAVAPVIISASRATDIPTFYGDWLLRRLKAGYVRWVNPWSRKSQYVSFENARLFVFWTKHPRRFSPVLDELDRRGIHCIFHYTINDYEREALEPGLPPLDTRIGTFKALSSRLGRECLLWRFDPLILTPELGPGELLCRVKRIGDELHGSAERLTVSFISLYAKVTRNMRKAGIRLTPWENQSREHLLQGIGDLGRSWNLPVVTCAEPEDLERFGISHGKCIDPSHLLHLWPGDEPLQRFLRGEGAAKDRGQRKHCGCVGSKDIGGYDSCANGCLYCYANESAAGAMECNRKLSTDGDAISAYSSNPSSAGTAGSSTS